MKKSLCLTLLLICLIFLSCEKEEVSNSSFKIEGLTLENYPMVDGSTSTDPLNKMIACKLLGYQYKWEQALHLNGTWYLSTDIPTEFVAERLRSSQTHNSIINLIDRKADLILSARKLSDEERAYADEVGVSLIETPIALDAFIFVVNLDNPVTSLTTNQVVEIYTGKIKNWKEVGGNDKDIKPYIRNQNSGSQELMESLVMKDSEIAQFEVDYESELPSMFLVFSTLRFNVEALCYTVYYYKEQIVRGNIVKSLAINGIAPNKKTIRNRNYPYVSEVYATIRSDIDKNSMAFKLYELLLSKAAEKVIVESGYIAK
jgi:phosphate transport system substrate-binding protein